MTRKTGWYSAEKKIVLTIASAILIASVSVFAILYLMMSNALQEDDARRENSPPGGVITLSKSLLHIRQQNYKNEGRGKNPSPCFHALRRCLVKAGSHVAARSSCGTARGLSPPARRETA